MPVHLVVLLKHITHIKVLYKSIICTWLTPHHCICLFCSLTESLPITEPYDMTLTIALSACAARGGWSAPYGILQITVKKKKPHTLTCTCKQYALTHANNTRINTRRRVHMQTTYKKHSHACSNLYFPLTIYFHWAIPSDLLQVGVYCCGGRRSCGIGT